MLGLIEGSLAGIEVGANVVVLNRHGEGDYVQPHAIDHAANMQRLRDQGCDSVIAITSVGGLRPEFAPGTLMCPDDFIALDAPSRSVFSDTASHIVPGFDPAWRDRLLDSLRAADAGVHDGGVYWQANGPRLETPAEVMLMAAHADVVGMTVASECVAACELGLPYAALCQVDNLANGVAGNVLDLDQIIANRAEAAALLAQAVTTAVAKLT